MKKFAVIILAVMLAGCAAKDAVSLPETMVSVSVTTDFVTTETTIVTTAETTTVTTTETTTVTAAETTTVTAAETTPETATEAAEETKAATTVMTSEFSSDTEYGNDIAGYIILPAGWDYSENEAGEFDITSPDGVSSVYSRIITGFGGDSEYNIIADIDMTAMLACQTMVMNAEIDGYERYGVSELQCSDIDGYCAVMLDLDGDLGIKLYCAFPDRDAGSIYSVCITSGDNSVENAAALARSIDSYHRNKSEGADI